MLLFVGENISVTPHGGSDALENPQPGELSETRPLLQDRSHTDEAEGQRVSESHCAANWYLFHMCLPIEGKQQPQRLVGEQVSFRSSSPAQSAVPKKCLWPPDG